MKTIIPILLSAFLISSMACKKKSKVVEKDDNISTEMDVEKTEETGLVKFEKVKDCDEFIDQYEAWMEDYLALLEKYKDNPMDLVSAPEYTQMTMQAVDWASNWSTKLTTSCAANPSYEKRMRKIQEKADKKLKDIGLRQ